MPECGEVFAIVLGVMSCTGSGRYCPYRKRSETPSEKSGIEENKRVDHGTIGNDVDEGEMWMWDSFRSRLRMGVHPGSCCTCHHLSSLQDRRGPIGSVVLVHGQWEPCCQNNPSPVVLRRYPGNAAVWDKVQGTELAIEDREQRKEVSRLQLCVVDESC